MKSAMLKMLVLAFTFLVSASVNAATYTFSFASYNNEGIKFDTGLLNFDTNKSGKIKSVTGNINGATITGLSNYASADNKFLVPTAATPYFATFGGISVATTDRIYNIAYYPVNGLNMTIADSVTDPAGYGAFNKGLNFTLVSNNGLNYSVITFADFNVAAVPEPETYTMMLLGLGLIMFSVQRRQVARI